MKTISPQRQAVKVQKLFLLRTKCIVLRFSILSILDDAMVSFSHSDIVAVGQIFSKARNAFLKKIVRIMHFL